MSCLNVQTQPGADRELMLKVLTHPDFSAQSIPWKQGVTLNNVMPCCTLECWRIAVLFYHGNVWQNAKAMSILILLLYNTRCFCTKEL